jgi:hypothetical protein
MLGNTAVSLDIGDLPIVPGSLRATYLFHAMRSTLSTIHLRRFMFWNVHPGSGWELAYRLACVNKATFTTQMALAAAGAVLYYVPPFFLLKLVRYLETDPERHDRSRGWLYSFGMFAATASLHLSGFSSFSPHPGADSSLVSKRSAVVSFYNDAAGQHACAVKLYSLCQDACEKRCRIVLCSIRE